MYCGAELVVGSIAVAPSQRPIESFEQAFNTVLGPARVVDPERAELELASALGIEREEAHDYIAAEKYLPLSRSQTRHEAELVAALVRTCGLGAVVVEDAVLAVTVELVRARRISVNDGSLIIGHSGGTLEIPASQISAIVVGLVHSNRVDFSEGGAGLRGNQEASVLDSYEFKSELMLMDVYCTSLENSFRVHANGFDYSGLVQPLSYRAEMNFQAAARAIAEIAPQAVVDDDFARVRRLLSRAWPERTRTESLGLRRGGANFAVSARSSLMRDNKDQFDRYSRLVFQLVKDKLYSSPVSELRPARPRVNDSA